MNSKRNNNVNLKEYDIDEFDIDKAYTILENIYSISKEKNGIDNSIGFSQKVEENLLRHQKMHVFNMISALEDKNNNSVLDGSDTGTGKTFTTSAVCRETKRRPFIICLKSNISTWIKVTRMFGVEPIAVVNYELIKSGKYYDKDKIVPCPYVKRDNNKFVWDFTEIGKKNMVMVFDEVHVCKGKTSLNSKLLTSCKNIKTIMLSATLCDKIEDFGIFGMMLGFYGSRAAGKNWLKDIIRKDKRLLQENSEKNENKKNQTNLLHKEIFNKKGSRMSFSELGKDIDENMVCIECYTIDPEECKKVNNMYDSIKQLKNRDTIALESITYKREKIENIKAEIFIEQTVNYYENKMSVVIFVNYRSTHDIITNALTKKKIDFAVIHGNQKKQERDDSINSFQRNEVRVMVSMAQAGGASINLDDVIGDYPRVSLISPSYAIIDLLQILGRIRRSSTKSRTLQKIIYCANTWEEHISEKLKMKEELMSFMTGENSIKNMSNTEKIHTNKNKIEKEKSSSQRNEIIHHKNEIIPQRKVIKTVKRNNII